MLVTNLSHGMELRLASNLPIRLVVGNSSHTLAIIFTVDLVFISLKFSPPLIIYPFQLHDPIIFIKSPVLKWIMIYMILCAIDEINLYERMRRRWIATALINSKERTNMTGFFDFLKIHSDKLTNSCSMLLWQHLWFTRYDLGECHPFMIKYVGSCQPLKSIAWLLVNMANYGFLIERIDYL